MHPSTSGDGADAAAKHEGPDERAGERQSPEAEGSAQYHGPSSRHSSRPPSRGASSGVLVPAQMQSGGKAGAVSSDKGARHQGHPPATSSGWTGTASEQFSTGEYGQQVLGSGQVSPQGEPSEGVFVDVRAESMSSLDGTQNSGSLYTANSVLSLAQTAAADAASSARASSGPIGTGQAAGAGGGAGAQPAGSSRMAQLHTVHSLNDDGMREYASERIEHAATAMEIVSGALRQPGNAWAQGAPIIEWGPAGGQALAPEEQVALPGGGMPVGIHLHRGVMHGDAFPVRQVDGITLTRYAYSQAADMMGAFGRGSDMHLQGVSVYSGSRMAPYMRGADGGNNMRRAGDGGHGYGRGKHKFGGRGNKLRSNSAGPYGGGRSGQHRYHSHRAHPHPVAHGGGGYNGAYGGHHQHTHSGSHSEGGSNGRLDEHDRPRSVPDVDPRFKLDNAAQFPALEGGSPRSGAPGAAAAAWPPAKDRGTQAYGSASPPATEAFANDAGPRLPVAPDAPALGGSGPPGGVASGRSSSSAAPAGAAGPHEHAPPRAWSETGSGGGAWVATAAPGATAGRGRHAPPAPPAGSGARTGPSSWSEVASSQPTGHPGRHTRSGSIGNVNGFSIESATRTWQSAVGRGGYGRGAGRRAGVHAHTGVHAHAGPHAHAHTAVGPVPRRGRSVDDDRNNTPESPGQGRGDSSKAPEGRPVGLVHVREH
jgi:hypothetical protein